MIPGPSENRLKWGAIGFCLIVCVGTAEPLRADGPPRPLRERKKTEKTEKTEKRSEDPRLLKIGIYLGILLAVAAASGLLLMLLWGARVRRQARKPLPATSPNDPLWYLKSKKPPQNEPDAPNSVSDENTDSDPPSSDSASS